ncbi:hypothetical protein [Mesorhizobium sp. 128a]
MTFIPEVGQYLEHDGDTVLATNINSADELSAPLADFRFQLIDPDSTIFGGGEFYLNDDLPELIEQFKSMASTDSVFNKLRFEPNFICSKHYLACLHVRSSSGTRTLDIFVSLNGDYAYVQPHDFSGLVSMLSEIDDVNVSLSVDDAAMDKWSFILRMLKYYFVELTYRVNLSTIYAGVVVPVSLVLVDEAVLAIVAAVSAAPFVVWWLITPWRSWREKAR